MTSADEPSPDGRREPADRAAGPDHRGRARAARPGQRGASRLAGPRRCARSDDHPRRLSAPLRLRGQHHRSRCGPDGAQEGRAPLRLSRPLRRRWREGPHHPRGPGDPGRRDGEPAVPGHALAGLLPLAAPARPGDRRHDLRDGREHRRRRGPADPRLRPAAGLRPADAASMARRASPTTPSATSTAARRASALRRRKAKYTEGVVVYQADGQRPAMPARSRPPAPRAARDARSSGPCTPSTSTACAPTTRPPPTRRRWPSGRSGSSRCSAKPRTGTACGGSGSAGSGR